MFQVQPLALQQREHRSGVGGADDGTKQQALQPVQLQQPGGKRTRQRGADQHPEAGQGHGGPQPHPEVFHPCAHAAIKQNDRQCQAADQKGGVGILELNTANTVHPGQHADDQEDQQ